MTLLHELGHVVDGYGFGVGRYYGSARMDLFRQWRQAIEGSSSYQHLEAQLDAGKLSWRQAALVRYLLLPREVWARSYAQYVAIHTDDARLNDELGAFLHDDAAVYIPEQ
jgi:hypothetical protein